MKKKTSIIMGMSVAFLGAGLLAACGEAKTYIVTFVTNGGTDVQRMSVEWGKTIGNIPATTKEGYTFTNWYTDAALKNPYSADLKVEENLTLYAGWSINQYTISFDTGVEGLVCNPITQNFGTVFEVPEISRDFYKFDAWFYDANYTLRFTTGDKVPGQNLTMYAKWIANTTTITFNKNTETATGTMNSKEFSESSDSKILPKCEFVNPGFDFAGWALTPEGEVVYTDCDDLEHISVSGPITLYAVWEVSQVKVSFYQIGSNNTFTILEETEPLPYGSPIGNPTNTPTLIGHNFIGWGRLQLTTDSKVDFKKVYYRSTGSNYSRLSLENEQEIGGLGYYEVGKVILANEQVTYDNNFYPVFEKMTCTANFVNKVTGEQTSNTGLYSSAITIPNAPTLPGYTFAGYFKDEACTDALSQADISSLTFRNEEVTFYLGYSVHKHNLTMLNGLVPVVPTTEYAYGTVLPLTEPTAEEGYQFVGWFDANNVEYTLGDTMPDDDLTLYARFEKITYTISFYDGDNLLKSIDAEFDSEVAYTAPEKTGYDFKGWFLDNETFAKPVSLDSYRVPSHNESIYAKYVKVLRSISFNSDGGTSVSTISNIPFETDLASYEPENPTKTGYTFAGWTLNGEPFVFAEETMPATNITLKAVWEAADVNVVINVMGEKLGSDGTYEELLKTETVQAKTGSTYKVASDAYSFTGYTYVTSEEKVVAADGSTTIEADFKLNVYNVTYIIDGKDPIIETRQHGATIGTTPSSLEVDQMITLFQIGETDPVENISDLVITADTEIKVTYKDAPKAARFIPNGGTIDGKTDYITVEFEPGETVVFPDSSKLARTGYTFIGWSIGADGEIINDTQLMPNKAVDFYARWQINSYKATLKDTYDDDYTEVSAAYNSKVDLRTDLTRTGYTFAGYVDGDGKEFPSSFTMPLGGIELTATWEANNVVVSFNANDDDAVGSMENASYDFESLDKSLPANTFTKEGYDFVGWATSEEGEVVYDDKDELPSELFDSEEKELDLYAVWAIGSYTIHFEGGAEGVTVPADITKNYGESLDTPAKPERIGYTFAGWFDESGNQYFFNKMGGKDITLTAHWEVNQYRVIFDINGGSAKDGALTPVKVENGKNLEEGGIVLPSVSESKLAKKGFEFDGWYTQDGTKVTAENLDQFVITNDDIILTAKWEALSYTITYHNGESTWGTPEEHKYGDPISKPEVDPVDPAGEGTFKGWYYISGYDEQSHPIFTFYNFSTMPAEDLDLYAQYTVNNIIVKYVDGNGNVVYGCSYSEVNNEDPLHDYLAGLLDRASKYNELLLSLAKATDGDLNETTALALYSLDEPTLRILSYVNGDLKLSPEAATALVMKVLTLPQEDLLNLQNCVLAGMGGGDPTSYIYALCTSANEVARSIGNEIAASPADMIAYYAQTVIDCKTMILPAMIKGGTSMDDAQVGAIVAKLDNIFAASTQEKVLIEQNSIKGALAAIVTAENQIVAVQEAYSIILRVCDELNIEYASYEGNANNPVSLKSDTYFDGWSQTYQVGSGAAEDPDVITYNPIWVSKATEVTNLKVTSSDNNSVTFGWDLDSTAYGYRVTIMLNGAEKQTAEVSTNTFTVNGLKKNDSVTCIVVKLQKSANGEYRQYSQAFDAKSVKTGESIHVERTLLDSNSVSLSYLHTAENDIGKVTKVGDYFYATDNDELILFVNTSYSFGSQKLEITQEDNPGIYDNIAALAKITTGVSKDNVLDIKNIVNNFSSFYLRVDGNKKQIIVREIPDVITPNSSLSKILSDNFTITNNTKNDAAYSSATFLGESKELLKVGASDTGRHVPGATYDLYQTIDQVRSIKYSNGYKFQIDTISTNGTDLKLEKEYSFKKWNGNEYVAVGDPSSLFEYDPVEDVVYFKNGNEGRYEVTITPKADNDVVNTFIPNAFKNSSSKMNRLTQVLEFELNEGVNVFDSFSLREATKAFATTAINISTDIKANFAASSVAYMPYLNALSTEDATAKSVADKIISSDDTKLTSGDASIIDRTAIMCEDTTYGPKIWNKVDSGGVFTAKDGSHYEYSRNGQYVIKDAEFKSNFDGGEFKIISLIDDISTRANLKKFGLETGSFFHRFDNWEYETDIGWVEKDVAEPLTVNGNYFDINASAAPFIRSSTHNSAGGTIATYEVQNVSSAIFYSTAYNTVTYKNINLIGNTSNESAQLSTEGTSTDFAEIMRLTSGGLSGFKTNTARNWIRDSVPKQEIIGCNITNALIAIYADASTSVKYTHVKNSWANGLYTYGVNDSVITIDHSVIEDSGGCAVQVDDEIYGYAEAGYNRIINPALKIDFNTTTIENFVSGDEQWFKAYTMEVLALGLKTKIDDMVTPMGYTIVQTIENPVTHLESEYMNWISFTQTDGIGNQSEKHVEDMGTPISFGSDDYVFAMRQTNPALGACGSIYIDPTSADVDGDVNAILVSNVGERAVTKKSYASYDDMVADKGSLIAGDKVINEADGKMYGFTGSNFMALLDLDEGLTTNPNNGYAKVFVELKVNMATQMPVSIGNQYLLFRQAQDGLGWIQGVLQLFSL